MKNPKKKKFYRAIGILETYLRKVSNGHDDLHEECMEAIKMLQWAQECTYLFKNVTKKPVDHSQQALKGKSEGE